MKDKKANSLNKSDKGNKKSDELYKLALEGADLAFWDWNIRSGEVTYSESWAEMLGYRLEEIKPDISSWERLVHPDDWQRFCRSLDLHFQGKTERYNCEYRMKTAYGSWKWVYTSGKIIERDERDQPLRAAGVQQDIDRRKTAEFEVDKQRAFFEQLFDGSPAGIALLDEKERVIRINRSFQKLFGYKQSEVEGRYLNELIIPEDKKTESEQLTQKAGRGITIEVETVRQNKHGELLNVQAYAYPITIRDEFLGIYAVYHDVTARKREEEEIRYLSLHDQLTGLYNRRYFEAELERLDKSRRLPIGVILADLDYLKYVNDGYGHKKGDQYIKDAAQAIKEALRKEDIAARIGGDEFAIILPKVDEHTLEEITSRIENRYREIGEAGNTLYHISMGYEIKQSENELLEDIVSSADRRMYINKESYKEAHLGERKYQ